MASRKADKEAARQRRLEEERARAASVRRTRRLQILGGTVGGAIIIAVVLVLVLGGSSGSKKAPAPNSKQAQTNASAVDKLLNGIPQNGATLGSPSAKVTITEYGDLQCPICADFARGAEDELIAKDVRSGKAKLVYRSFPTASQGASDFQTIFPLQQAAALAAGGQKKAWNYIELFYREQGKEGTDYVNTAFLQSLAKQTSGLNYATWNSQRFNPKFSGQVVSDGEKAQSIGISATPTIVVQGTKSQTKPQSGNLSYDQLQSMIKSVS